MVHEKMWLLEGRTLGDTLVFNNMLRELLKWTGCQPSEHSVDLIYFEVYVVMVWLSEMGNSSQKVF